MNRSVGSLGFAVVGTSNHGSNDAFEVVPDDKLNKNVNGVTLGGNYIQVKKSREGTETGAHEIAHAMGVVHSSKGLMTAESSSSFRNKELDKGSIKDMIQYPLKGKVNSEYNQEKGQIPAGKGTLRNNSPFSIKDLQRGKIKSCLLYTSPSPRD